MTRASHWTILVDTGGTFTDCIAIDPTGRTHRAKVLTTAAIRVSVERVGADGALRIATPFDLPDGFFDGCTATSSGTDRDGSRVVESGRDGRLVCSNVDSGLRPGDTLELRSPDPAPILAARIVTRTPHGCRLPAMKLRLASTLATNALLERRSLPVALFVTRGFRDLLLIGNQTRPDIFALKIDKPQPLFDRVVEVDERLAADGTVVTSLDLEGLRAAASAVIEEGVTSAAIAFLHSFENDEHERLAEQTLFECGFDIISRSSELAPLVRILPRAQTAVIDAFVAPVVGSYLDRIQGQLPAQSLFVMTSAGGIVAEQDARPKDLLLSGPAGGVVGAAAIGTRGGHERVIAFDMGGTSTDVCRIDREFAYDFEHSVGDATILAPALAIRTVAAGGGSLCTYRDGHLRVGPASAGASPGPACYGMGGPLTLTDVNLLLGRLAPEYFQIPIDVAAAERALDEVRAAVVSAGHDSLDRQALLHGFLDIADETIAEAIRQVSVREGADPADFALVSFGGAGGQHACRVAERLGIRRVVMPEDASLLSAAGLADAVVERIVEQQVLAPLDESGIEERIASLCESARELMVETEDDVEIRRVIVRIRLQGQSATIDVNARTRAEIESCFREEFKILFGYEPPAHSIEVESIRVIASCGHALRLQRGQGRRGFQQTPGRVRGASPESIDRADIKDGDCLRGPVMIHDTMSTYIIEKGWACRVDPHGSIVAERQISVGVETVPSRHSAIERELFGNRLEAIAREMGQLLERIAISTNVRDRRDFSCALLDRDGRLVAHAPHMPVHLGAMGVCVRSVMRALPMHPGDVVITNHPGLGGSHLPDITLITPIFVGDRLVGFAANRAHHAEIGGTRPGSMPPEARSLAEEGVVIPPTRLVDRGRPGFDAIATLLTAGPYPTRSIADNMADLRGQLAANRRAEQRIGDMANELGVDRTFELVDRLFQHASHHARQAILEIPDGRYDAQEALDDGSLICVSIDVVGDAATVDFGGSSAVHPGNLNATPAIVTSAVMYVLRVLVGEALPLNEGLFEALTIRIPPGMLNPDFSRTALDCPAVVGGNTEVSQRIVDTLFKALGIAAASQGTMNNVLFGTAEWAYYETLCGGCGAGPGFVGASATHSHMTNTRLTDIELLERRYPVRVQRFELRRGSGGAGRWRGGDGVRREVMFLEPMDLTVLTQRRRSGPFGLVGGGDGLPGSQILLRADGTRLKLESIDGCHVLPGDRLVIESPGGGGFGQPAQPA